MRYLMSTVLILIAVNLGSAAEVLCVDRNTAQVLSSPWSGALVRLEVPENYPLLVDGNTDGFSHVTDFQGRSGWVASTDLAVSHCAVVSRSRVNVRQQAGTTHPIAFKAKEGVAFLVAAASDHWVQVKHETGKSGWIHKDLVWGNY